MLIDIFFLLILFYFTDLKGSSWLYEISCDNDNAFKTIMLRNKLYSLNVILCFAIENQCRVSENPYDCIINDLSFFRWANRNGILKLSC